MTPSSFRPMDRAELEMSRAIAPHLVSYLPGTFWKRFAHTLSAASVGDQLITDRQAATLRTCVWRHRRQLPESHPRARSHRTA